MNELRPHTPHGDTRHMDGDAMTSVAEFDTEKGVEKGFESDEATSFYNSGPEWERAVRTFFLNSAAASFVTEIALFVVTPQITYNYKYVGSYQ